MNNPIDFFKSLFKNRKTTLTGNEIVSLPYLHPEKGAINSGDYCTTQDIANLSPPYVMPEDIFINTIYPLMGNGVIIDGVLLKDGFIDPKSINAIEYYNVTATGLNATGAKLLQYGYNQVTTATSSGKCVALPDEITSQKLYIKNSTSESIDVYGNQLGEFIIQDVTNSYPSTWNSITLNPGQSVELIRVGSVWLAVSFNGVANKPLIYKAILTQNGTNAPVATVLNSNDSNYLDIVWTRNGDGSYLGTYNGITNTNTILHVSGAFADTFGYDAKAISDAVWITQYNGAVATDGILYLYVTIEYYGS